MDDTGFLGIVGKASGDFMREFTTAWRQGIPIAPPGSAVQASAGGTVSQSPRQPTATTAPATQAAPDLSAIGKRLAALEASVRELERRRLEAVIHAHAVHVVYQDLLAEHLSIHAPGFKDAIKAAISACSELQVVLAESGHEHCDPEQMLASSGYNKLLRQKVRAAISIAAIGQQPEPTTTTDG